MRIGIISDVHANVEGLRAALDRMGEVDALFCAGDILEQYRFSNETLEILRDRGAHCVLGNHDVIMLSHHGERARSAPGVDQRLVDWLGSHPLRLDVEIDGLRVMMAHGSPCPPHHQYLWPNSAELDRLAGLPADVVIVGHTHHQMSERVGDMLVVNPGSVGHGRDPRNGRALSYAVLDTATMEVGFDDYFIEPVSLAPAG